MTPDPENAAETRAQEILERRRAERSLLDFVPYASPHYEAPRHLQRYVDAIEAALEREQRVVISTPPQHGKTETTLHGLIWYMRRHPGRRNGYVSYEAMRAEDMSVRCMQIADSVGEKPDGSRRMWSLPDRSCLFATGIGGPLTGYAIDGLLIVDDPFKNRQDADSSVIRERTDDWFRSVAMTRVHPGASVLVIQTRWHPDDLAGRLIERGWAHINLPAIDDAGDALWPSQRPLAWLEERRQEVGEFDWASLYQGDPRPRGGRVFGDARQFETLPNGLRLAIGIDLAYTEKTYADYSVAVLMGESGGTYYVLDVKRVQVEAPKFASVLWNLASANPTARMHSFVSGTEKGVVDYLIKGGLPIVTSPCKTDKFMRAQPVAAAWNAGRVLVPRHAPWLPAFISEVGSFTGVKDRHDDQVDALAGAFAVLQPGPHRNISNLPPI